MLAIAFRWFGRSVRTPEGLRAAFQHGRHVRELNQHIEDKIKRQRMFEGLSKKQIGLIVAILIALAGLTERGGWLPYT